MTAGKLVMHRREITIAAISALIILVCTLGYMACETKVAVDDLDAALKTVRRELWEHFEKPGIHLVPITATGFPVSEKSGAEPSPLYGRGGAPVAEKGFD